MEEEVVRAVLGTPGMTWLGQKLTPLASGRRNAAKEGKASPNPLAASPVDALGKIDAVESAAQALLEAQYQQARARQKSV